MGVGILEGGKPSGGMSIGENFTRESVRRLASADVVWRADELAKLLVLKKKVTVVETMQALENVEA